MINKERISSFGLEYIGDYHFDDTHISYIFKKDRTCFIIDDDICKVLGDVLFDYSKYCEMQNKYSAQYDRLYRVNIVSEKDYDKIHEWLIKTPDDISIEDTGGTFDTTHTDNTPLEKTFEDLFLETYGDNAAEFLKKEYSISLNDGKNAFVDYVIETKTGNYGIEEKIVSQ